MSSPDTDKILMAIDKIANDPDKKYDECVIERFFAAVSDELEKLEYNDWIVASKGILSRLQSYVDDEAFVMMNQARVYKAYSSVFKSRIISEVSLKSLQEQLDSFWSSLGSVVINHNLAAVTAVVVALRELVNSRPVYLWIIAMKFQPIINVTVKGREFEIADVATLAEFYIETSENYHTRNKAELFFQCLIEYAITKDLEQTHQHFMTLKNLVTRLIESDSTTILHILISIIEKKSSAIPNDALLEVYNLMPSLKKRLIVDSENSHESLSTLCKLLALISKDNETIIAQLRKRGQIDALIDFLSLCPSVAEKRLLISYIVGPIAQRCGAKLDDKLEILEDTLRGNITDKTVTHCLAQLNHIIEQPKSLASENVESSTRVLLIYVDRFIGAAGEFKNVMLCCSTMKKLLGFYMESEILVSVISTVIDIMQRIDMHDETLKPIVLTLIQIVYRARRCASSFPYSPIHEAMANKLIDLSSKCKDNDIKKEFRKFFMKFHRSHRPYPDEELSDLEWEPEEAVLKATIDYNSSYIIDFELFDDSIPDCY